ncbi:unnamed protein product, partial [Dibothriocephalus latus]
MTQTRRKKKCVRFLTDAEYDEAVQSGKLRSDPSSPSNGGGDAAAACLGGSGAAGLNVCTKELHWNDSNFSQSRQQQQQR